MDVVRAGTRARKNGVHRPTSNVCPACSIATTNLALQTPFPRHMPSHLERLHGPQVGDAPDVESIEPQVALGSQKLLLRIGVIRVGRGPPPCALGKRCQKVVIGVSKNVGQSGWYCTGVQAWGTRCQHAGGAE